MDYDTIEKNKISEYRSSLRKSHCWAQARLRMRELGPHVALGE